MKNSQYFKYAIGEIFLVVIGILIALSINTWNEARKDNNRAEMTKSILVGEIEENLSQLKENHSRNEEILDSLTLYFKDKLKKSGDYEKAFFIGYVLNYSWGLLKYPTVEQELGPNRVIKFDEKLDDLLKSLSSSHASADFQLNYLNELFNNQTIPFMLQEGAGNDLINTMFRYSEEVKKLSVLYSSEPLDNILSIQQLFLFSYNNKIKRLIDASETTLKYLRTN